MALRWRMTTTYSITIGYVKTLDFIEHILHYGAVRTFLDVYRRTHSVNLFTALLSPYSFE